MKPITTPLKGEGAGDERYTANKTHLNSKNLNDGVTSVALDCIALSPSSAVSPAPWLRPARRAVPPRAAPVRCAAGLLPPAAAAAAALVPRPPDAPAPAAPLSRAPPARAAPSRLCDEVSRVPRTGTSRQFTGFSRNLIRPSSLTLSLPRVINLKILLQPHQQYYTTQYEEFGVS